MTWSTTSKNNATNNVDLHTSLGQGTQMDGTGTGDYVPLQQIRAELFTTLPLHGVNFTSFALQLLRQTEVSRILENVSPGQVINIRTKGLPVVQDLGADCAITPTVRKGKNVSVTFDKAKYVFEEMCQCFSDNPCGDGALYDIHDVVTLRKEADLAIAKAIDMTVFDKTTGIISKIPATKSTAKTRLGQIVKSLGDLQDTALTAGRIVTPQSMAILVNPDTLTELKLDPTVTGMNFLNDNQKQFNPVIGAIFKGTLEGHPVWSVPSTFVDKETGWVILDTYGFGIAVACSIEKVTDGGNTSLRAGYVKSVNYGFVALDGVDNLSIKGKALPAPAVSTK